ncbi:response regulator transcription factor, partial [Kitasatospora cineracea]|uniref:response regulator transcription factor n=2 Tax=Streptomycetaceae TaxID=2062 RepID=UPI0033D699F6
LALMAEGLSNAAIAARLFLSEGSVGKYTTAIFGKLGLVGDEDTNRRVRAVLAYLDAGRAA